MSETGAREIGSTAPGHYGGDGRDVVLSRALIATAWNVQADPARASDAAAAEAERERLLGVALPLVPNTTQLADALLALWLGPRSWLLVESARRTPPALVDFEATRDALNAGGGALFDVSASRVAFSVRGALAGAILARSCPLDFDPRAFAAGHCAQSMLGRVAALFYRHAQAPAFTVMVARSLATDVWHALCVAAATEGYDVAAPAAFDAD